MQKNMLQISQRILLFSVIVFVLMFHYVIAEELGSSGTKAKNVIIMIGDGMGFNSDIAGTLYRFGEPNKQRYHSFPVNLASTTFSFTKNADFTKEITDGYNPELFWKSYEGITASTKQTATTDSAAAATVLASGVKTTNGRIGTAPDGKSVKLLTELAVEYGKKAGTVTSVTTAHATPAGFSAHVDSRAEMDEIFRQMIDPKGPLTVVMGAGHPLYDFGIPAKSKPSDPQKRFASVGGEDVWKELTKGNYGDFTVIESKEQFEEIAAGNNVPKKLIGLPRSSEWIPPVDGFLDDMPETIANLESAFPKMDRQMLPSLASMSLAALNVLDNTMGFFLVIEGGAIDWANHSNKIDRSCCEHVAFAKAIDAVIDWVEKNSSWSETLLVITSDHETGGLWGQKTYIDSNENGVFDKGESFTNFKPIENQGRGKYPLVQYVSKSHSNALVPVCAKGAGASQFEKYIRGTDTKAGEFWKFNGKYIDNSDIFRVMQNALVP